MFRQHQWIVKSLIQRIGTSLSKYLDQLNKEFIIVVYWVKEKFIKYKTIVWVLEVQVIVYLIEKAVLSKFVYNLEKPICILSKITRLVISCSQQMFLITQNINTHNDRLELFFINKIIILLNFGVLMLNINSFNLFIIVQLCKITTLCFQSVFLIRYPYYNTLYNL